MIKKAKRIPPAPKNRIEENKLNFILEDSIPKTQTERKKFVADCAFFYSTIFKKKLEHFVGMELLELSIRGRTKEYDDMIRANINCFTQINSWMEKMYSEHLGNMNEIRNSFDEDKDIINKLNKTYGENKTN